MTLSSLNLIFFVGLISFFIFLVDKYMEERKKRKELVEKMEGLLGDLE